jgi:hypothetical protein
MLLWICNYLSYNCLMRLLQCIQAQSTALSRVSDGCCTNRQGSWLAELADCMKIFSVWCNRLHDTRVVAKGNRAIAIASSADQRNSRWLFWFRSCDLGDVQVPGSETNKRIGIACNRPWVEPQQKLPIPLVRPATFLNVSLGRPPPANTSETAHVAQSGCPACEHSLSQ